MLRKVSLIAFAGLAGSATLAHAGAIDFRVGSSVAELTYLSQVASFGYGGADIGFGLLANNDNDFVGSASMLVSGNSAGDVKALHFGVGVKAYAGNLDNASNTIDNQTGDISGGALAIGGKIRYVFPGSTPLAVLGEIFYAADITSLSDFNGVNEFRAAVEYEVTPSARAYVGYRRLQIDFNNAADYDIDNSAHIGVRFEF